MKSALVIFLFLLATALPAQTFMASLIAGGNISQIDGDQLDGYHKLGANAGIRVVARLGDRWRVGPEILFSQQGARRNANSLNTSPFNRFDLTTLEIPLMAFYQDWRIMGEFGLSYQRLINYRVLSDIEDDITADINLRDNLVAYKLGATFFITPSWAVNMRFSKHIFDIDVDEQVNNFFKGKSVSLRAIFTLGRGETIPKPPAEPE